MAKGLIGKSTFIQFSSYQQKVIDRLAEIEMEDESRCNECSGEDCICCEYWHDRQKWVSADELFSHEVGDPMYDDEERHFENYLNHLIEDCEDEEFDVPKEKCDKCDARFCCDERKEN